MPLGLRAQQMANCLRQVSTLAAVEEEGEQGQACLPLVWLLGTSLQSYRRPGARR